MTIRHPKVLKSLSMDLELPAGVYQKSSMRSDQGGGSIPLRQGLGLFTDYIHQLFYISFLLTKGPGEVVQGGS